MNSPSLIERIQRSNTGSADNLASTTHVGTNEAKRKTSLTYEDISDEDLEKYYLEFENDIKILPDINFRCSAGTVGINLYCR